MRLTVGTGADPRPLVVHVVSRFDTGGLENGVVNLINHMPASAYRHAVLALTEVTDFSQRVRHADVRFIALRKAPGHGFKLYPRLWRLLRNCGPLWCTHATWGRWKCRWPPRWPVCRCVCTASMAAS